MENKNKKNDKLKIKKNVLFMAVYMCGLITIPILAVIPGWGTTEAPGGVPTDIRQALMNMINWTLGFVAMIATLMIIYGGVLYLTSGGREEQVEAAKKTIAYAVIGTVVCGLAYAMVNVVMSVILVP